ncbi:hypothetical protein CDL15_Pgr010503 [Punica granatum]|uniref:Uncharacterized protein n=1 Tax=Punica granatum TaxID=22663 RepID=A0A218XX46_PUNGR|nr:hypothetical protein CDL15_Pgr010503 [Punica granatum]
MEVMQVKFECRPKSPLWNSLQARNMQSEQLRLLEHCGLAGLVVSCDTEVRNTTCRRVNFGGCIIVKLKKLDTSEEYKGGLDLSNRIG